MVGKGGLPPFHAMAGDRAPSETISEPGARNGPEMACFGTEMGHLWAIFGPKLLISGSFLASGELLRSHLGPYLGHIQVASHYEHGSPL